MVFENIPTDRRSFVKRIAAIAGGLGVLSISGSGITAADTLDAEVVSETVVSDGKLSEDTIQLKDSAELTFEEVANFETELALKTDSGAYDDYALSTFIDEGEITYVLSGDGTPLAKIRVQVEPSGNITFTTRSDISETTSTAIFAKLTSKFSQE